jgi:hypothetical protein
MRIIKLSENGKDVYLSITKEDVVAMLVSAEFWLNTMPVDGLVSAKFVRLIRLLGKDPDYFTENSDTAYDIEIAEFLLYLNNGCHELKIVIKQP